jgi:hypothetical protein
MSNDAPSAMRAWVIPGVCAHLEAIVSDGLRASDRRDLGALGVTPEELYDASGHDAFTIVVEGRPVAMFGAVPVRERKHHGTVWLLASDGIARARELIETQGTAWLNYLNDDARYPVVRCWVAEDNVASRGWIERRGFQLNNDDEMRGVRFLHFYRTGPQTIN